MSTLQEKHTHTHTKHEKVKDGERKRESEQLCFDVLFNDPIKAKGGFSDMYDMFTQRKHTCVFLSLSLSQVWKYVFILLFYEGILFNTPFCAF